VLMKELVIFDERTETEVCKLDVAIGVQQHILWFEITVHHADRVKVLDGQNDTSRIEPHHVFTEFPKAVEMEAKLTARQEVHHNVEVAFILEGVLHRHNERVIHTGQDVAFVHDQLLSLLLHNLELGHGLASIQRLSVILHDRVHLAETSFSKNTEERKLIIRHDRTVFCTEAVKPLVQLRIEKRFKHRKLNVLVHMRANPFKEVFCRAFEGKTGGDGLPNMNAHRDFLATVWTEE